MTSTRPPEQRRNSYSDEDLAQVIERIEAAKSKEADTKATAAADRKRTIKVIEAEAKNVGIPVNLLRKTMKMRDLERKMEDLSTSVKDSEIEVFYDMQGQSSWLKPDDAHPAESSAQIAARISAEQRQARTEEDDIAGQAALSRLRSVN